MKYLLIFILALAGGFLGFEGGQHAPELFGATTARTTITNPWTFQATTTTANITATTANTATSSIEIGCIDTYATSTATAGHFVVGSTLHSTTTFDGSNSNYLVGFRFGKCPRL